MKKNRIKLTESQLHKVIKESVKRVLKESTVRNINELFTDMQTLSDGAAITKYKCEDDNDPEWSTFKYVLTDEYGSLIGVYYE